MQSIQILIDGSHGNGTEIYQETESESETRILISREKSHKSFHNIGHSRQIVRVNWRSWWCNLFLIAFYGKISIFKNNEEFSRWFFVIILGLLFYSLITILIKPFFWQIMTNWKFIFLQPLQMRAVSSPSLTENPLENQSSISTSPNFNTTKSEPNGHVPSSELNDRGQHQTGEKNILSFSPVFLTLTKLFWNLIMSNCIFFGDFTLKRINWID